MTNRFYDNLLDAYYMQENYGMKFLIKREEKYFPAKIVMKFKKLSIQFNDHICYAHSGEPIDWDITDTRLYIHSDSIHILKPEIGDYVLMYHKKISDGYLLDTIMDIRYVSDGGAYEVLYSLENENYVPIERIKILYRNGRPFIVPSN